MTKQLLTLLNCCQVNLFATEDATGLVTTKRFWVLCLRVYCERFVIPGPPLCSVVWSEWERTAAPRCPALPRDANNRRASASNSSVRAAPPESYQIPAINAVIRPRTFKYGGNEGGKMKIKDDRSDVWLTGRPKISRFFLIWVKAYGLKACYPVLR